MNKLYTTILFFWIWSFSFSQQYTNYTTKNGLPSNHIYRITQDNDGFIWFITDKGMVKFNGDKFKTYTTKEGLPTNDVWDIRVAEDNKIWYFSKSSKLGYIENDSVYSFESKIKNEVLYPIVINQNKNIIFFSNGREAYRLENKFWKSESLYVSDGYSEIIEHHTIEKLLVSRKLDSLYIFDKKQKKIKSLKLDLGSYIYKGQLNDSLFCWIQSNEIDFLNLNTLKFKKTYYSSNPKMLTRYSVTDDNIQFSGENFVAFLDKNYQFKDSISIPENLNSHFSFLDRNKNLWIATFTNGVYFLPLSKRIATYTLTNLKVGDVKKVNTDIVANVYQKGFYKYDNSQKKFQPYIKEQDFIYSANYFKEINSYYYITNNKAIQIKEKKKQIITKPNIARDLVYYNKFLYGNTSYGLNKINPKTYTIIKEYSQNGLRDILLFKDEIFMATANGIKCLSNDTILPIKIKGKEFTKPIISLVAYDSNHLIACTDGFGAYITDLDTIKLLEQSNFLNVQSATVKNGNLWLATNQGIWYYEKIKDTFKLKRKYTTNDGLALNQTNHVFIVNDTILASSNDGVSIIPQNMKRNEQFIDIYFESINYNNNEINNNKEITYSSGKQLQVKVESIDFSENTELTYAYQLLPIQKKWISTNSKQISFHQLPPDYYKLSVKSKNKITMVKFKILPLWYQTVIAKIIFGLLGLFLIISVILLVKKRELTKQAKRLTAQKKLADFELHALRSQMNPHFVFNSLNAIQYFITKNEIELSEKYLVKFSRLIRMFFDFSREKEILLRQEIDLLNGYLEIERMRFGDDFNYQIEIINNLGAENFKMPAMLLQPIVENAVNHGLFHNKGKGLIEVYFTFLTENSIEVIIIDDGVGIKRAKEIQENSLKTTIKKNNSTNIIKERINLLNQTKKWEVTYQVRENTKNKGTIVQLIFTRNG